MRLVLIGAPAAGKGTQARKLISYYGLTYISTGDILREHINNKTELGNTVQSVISAGKLVSDDLMIEIVKERVSREDCKNGFILDGFPRTEVQAIALDKIIGKITKAVYINVSDEIMLDRITGRRVCNECGMTYHTSSNPSKVSGVCDVCEKELIQRKDDTRETGIERLKAFHDSADALVEYYRKENLLLEVDGVGDIDEISKSIISELGERA